jgi:hypothetical protein
MLAPAPEDISFSVARLGTIDGGGCDSRLSSRKNVGVLIVARRESSLFKYGRSVALLAFHTSGGWSVLCLYGEHPRFKETLLC